MTLGLLEIVAPLVLVALLVVLIIGYRRSEETQRAKDHAAIMTALHDGAVTRAKILAMVEDIHHDLTAFPGEERIP